MQETIQIDSMTESFRNRLINAYELTISQFYNGYIWIDAKFSRAYFNHFGLLNREDMCLDSFMLDVKENAKNTQYGVYFLYDFMEFLIEYYKHNVGRGLNLISGFNKILELEKSAYRLTKNGILIPITDEIELAELEQASYLSKPYSGIYNHLKKARISFSNRKNPDYKKAIIESVHAIESLCKIILNNDKATLGQAVKELKLHSALEQSIVKLYGFASDGSGIRHANKSNTTDCVDEHDARLILVSSHSIVNYLISKKLNKNDTN